MIRVYWFRRGVMVTVENLIGPFYAIMTEFGRGDDGAFVFYHHLASDN